MNEQEPVDPRSESGPAPRKQRGLSREESIQQAGPYMTLGIQLVLTMLALGAIGWWLDGRWGSAPWLMVTGLLVGAIGGMVNVIRLALRSSNETRARARSRQPDSSPNDSHTG